MPDSSYCEFNDATAKIRGYLLGADGEFNGSFSAGSIIVRDKINVQDGSVGRFIFVNPVTPMLLAHTVVIPANSVAVGNWAVFRLGIRVESTLAQVYNSTSWQQSGYTMVAYAANYKYRLQVKKNGVLIKSIENNHENRFPSYVSRDVYSYMLPVADAVFDRTIDNTYEFRLDLMTFGGWYIPWGQQRAGWYYVDPLTSGLTGPISPSASRICGFDGPTIAEFLYK